MLCFTWLIITDVGGKPLDILFLRNYEKNFIHNTSLAIGECYFNWKQRKRGFLVTWWIRTNSCSYKVFVLFSILQFYSDIIFSLLLILMLFQFHPSFIIFFVYNLFIFIVLLVIFLTFLSRLYTIYVYIYYFIVVSLIVKFLTFFPRLYLLRILLLFFLFNISTQSFIIRTCSLKAINYYVYILKTKIAPHANKIIEYNSTLIFWTNHSSRIVSRKCLILHHIMQQRNKMQHLLCFCTDSNLHDEWMCKTLNCTVEAMV